MKYIESIAPTKKDKEVLFRKYLEYGESTMSPFYILKPKLIGEKNGQLVFARSFMTLIDEEYKIYTLLDDFTITSINCAEKDFVKDDSWHDLMPFNKLWFAFMCKELNKRSQHLKDLYVQDFASHVRNYREQQKYKIERIYNNETEEYIKQACDCAEKNINSKEE